MSMSIDVDSEVSPALRALAEPLRWQIIELLAHEELCVCHLVDSLDVPQPLVSHHLRALREANLVETSRHRYWTYYRLRPEVLSRLADTLAALASTAPRADTRRRPCC